MANTWKRKLEQDPSVYIKKLKLEPQQTVVITEGEVDEVPQSPDLFQTYTVSLPDSDSDNSDVDHHHEEDDDTYHTQDPQSHTSSLTAIVESASQRYIVAPPFHLYTTNSLPAAAAHGHPLTITPEHTNPHLALIPYVDNRVIINQPLPPTNVDVTTNDRINSNSSSSRGESDCHDDDDAEPMEIE